MSKVAPSSGRSGSSARQRSGGGASAPAPRGGKPAPPSGGKARPSAPTRTPAPPARLRIVEGPGAGTEYAIAGPLVRLGRGEENDIVLPDGNASRNHAELVRDASGRYVVRDLGSRNGIFVNRKKVPQAVLASGDRVTIGGTIIEFVMAGMGPAGAGSGSPVVRWVVVGVMVVVLGFVLSSMVGGKSAGPLVEGLSPVTGPGTADPGGETAAPVKPGDPTSLGSLLSTSKTEAAPNGVGVGRNTSTKATNAPPAVPTPAAVSETEISAIMLEGERQFSSGKLPDARANFARAVKLDPTCERCNAKLLSVEKQVKKDIETALTAGINYSDTGRYDEAIMAFEKVKLLDNDPTSVNNGAATRYIDEVRKKKAEEALR